jgi:hypothetical protein
MLYLQFFYQENKADSLQLWIIPNRIRSIYVEMAFHSYYVHIRISFHISCTDDNMGRKFANLICCLDTVYFNQCYTIFTITLLDEYYMLSY